jgi:hypothetical protein
MRGIFIVGGISGKAELLSWHGDMPQKTRGTYGMKR